VFTSPPRPDRPCCGRVDEGSSPSAWRRSRLLVSGFAELPVNLN
jgi:hypothetical protein